MTQYPRVLLITIVKVKKEDAGSLLIRTQFADWPKDHLAQIHASADPVGYGEFCGSYYRLQNCDRRFGGLFARLRGSVFNMVAVDKVAKARPVAETWIRWHIRLVWADL